MVPDVFTHQPLLNIRVGYFLPAINPEREAAVAQIIIYFLTYVHFHELREMRSIILYLVVSTGWPLLYKCPAQAGQSHLHSGTLPFHQLSP